MSLFGRSSAEAVRPPLVSTYYLQFDGQEYGPYTTQQLQRLPRFTLGTPVRDAAGGSWRPAFQVLDLKAYFSRTPPATSYEKAAAMGGIQAALGSRAKSKRSFRPFRFIGGLMKALLVPAAFLGIVFVARSASEKPLPIDLKIPKISVKAHAHQAIQTAIKRLTDLDRRYFLPSAPSKPQ
jgi:hypothetical protein